MREQIEVALKDFLERPTSQNKQALESLIQTYPDFFIEQLVANTPHNSGPTPRLKLPKPARTDSVIRTCHLMQAYLFGTPMYFL